MALNSSAPNPAAVAAASGGHPANPWREQRLLFLYQAPAGSEAAPDVQAGDVPGAIAA